MNTEKDILLRRIANHLILHSIDIEDIGLFHGKMGLYCSLHTTQDIQIKPYMMTLQESCLRKLVRIFQKHYQ